LDTLINIKEATKKKVIESLGKNATIDTIIDYLFDAEIADKRRCQIALIKDTYFDLLKKNHKNRNFKALDAKTITAEKFGVSEKMVENCIYYYKDIAI